MKRVGQGEGRGEGNFGENVALLFTNLGQEKEGEENGKTRTNKSGSAPRLCLMERGGGVARIKHSFSSMPALGHVM